MVAQISQLVDYILIIYTWTVWQQRGSHTTMCPLLVYVIYLSPSGNNPHPLQDYSQPLNVYNRITKLVKLFGHTLVKLEGIKVDGCMAGCCYPLHLINSSIILVLLTTTLAMYATSTNHLCAPALTLSIHNT